MHQKENIKFYYLCEKRSYASRYCSVYSMCMLPVVCEWILFTDFNVIATCLQNKIYIFLKTTPVNIDYLFNMMHFTSIWWEFQFCVWPRIIMYSCVRVYRTISLWAVQNTQCVIHIKTFDANTISKRELKLIMDEHFICKNHLFFLSLYLAVSCVNTHHFYWMSIITFFFIEIVHTSYFHLKRKSSINFINFKRQNYHIN